MAEITETADASHLDSKMNSSDTMFPGMTEDDLSNITPLLSGSDQHDNSSQTHCVVDDLQSENKTQVVVTKEALTCYWCHSTSHRLTECEMFKEHQLARGTPKPYKKKRWGNRANQSCTFCGRPGHRVEICRELKKHRQPPKAVESARATTKQSSPMQATNTWKPKKAISKGYASGSGIRMEDVTLEMRVSRLEEMAHKCSHALLSLR